MPFISIPASWIQAGKPTKEELFQRISDNMEQFNTDIAALQQTAGFQIFDVKVSGFPQRYLSSEVTERLPVFKAHINGNITSVVITLLTGSTSGTLNMEIDKSTDNGANWTPILSTPVALSGTAVGSISGAVNFINLAAQQFNQNNLLRIRFTSFQNNQGNFHVSIYGEVN